MTNPNYSRHSDPNRPQTVAEVEAAARALSADGFSVFTVAHLLQLDVNAVRGILGDRSKADS